MIFCGDFNSRPDTAVYQFLSERSINMDDKNLESRKLFSVFISAKFVNLWSFSVSVGKSNVFQNNFKFKSACGTPKFTNYTDDFKGCLDYIFCEKDVKVTQVLPFPSEEELSRNIAIPNQYFPSDHIALVADLKF